MRSSLEVDGVLRCTKPGSELLAFEFREDGSMDAAWCGDELAGRSYAYNIQTCSRPLSHGSGYYTFDGTTLTVAIDGESWFLPTRVAKTAFGFALDRLYFRSDRMGFVPATQLP